MAGMGQSLDGVRLPPLAAEEFSPELTEGTAPAQADFIAHILGINGGRPSNVIATIARHPALFRSYLPFSNHLYTSSTLDGRDRELLVLRTGWMCRARFEWAQHVNRGRAAGIDEREIAWLRRPAADGDWSDRDRMLVDLVDELHTTSTVTQPTWDRLAGYFDEQQILDALFTVGQYHMVAFLTNACGTPLNDGAESFPEG